MGIEVLIPIFGVMVVLVPITGLTVIMMLRLGRQAVHRDARAGTARVRLHQLFGEPSEDGRSHGAGRSPDVGGASAEERSAVRSEAARGAADCLGGRVGLTRTSGPATISVRETRIFGSDDHDRHAFARRPIYGPHHLAGEVCAHV